MDIVVIVKMSEVAKKYTNNTEEDGVQIKLVGPIMKETVLGDNYGDFGDIVLHELNQGQSMHKRIGSRVFVVKGVFPGQILKVFTGPETKPVVDPVEFQIPNDCEYIEVNL